MPLGRRVAHANKIGLNRVMRHVVPWFPGFGIVTHRGRNSGRTFTTPVNVFGRSGGYLFALTYGKDADWVRNVEHAGECHITTRGQTRHLVNPRIVRDESRSAMPLVVRTVLGWLKVYDFLLLDSAPES